MHFKVVSINRCCSYLNKLCNLRYLYYIAAYCKSLLLHRYTESSLKFKCCNICLNSDVQMFFASSNSVKYNTNAVPYAKQLSLILAHSIP
ncbi:hypothetical protein T10_3667 [Trichinella papuae]|uniref:Uncharacterized protein n=1 Tax=Trichinella papuae TaxID=268474 RepID=A0A0V1N7A6_9BILA|nr:hypothetical protein T10_3667 [Trichinella papuae]